MAKITGGMSKAVAGRSPAIPISRRQSRYFRLRTVDFRINARGGKKGLAWGNIRDRIQTWKGIQFRTLSPPDFSRARLA